MKRFVLAILMAVVSITAANAQYYNSKITGTCGRGTTWVFDGVTLTISNDTKGMSTVTIADYDLKKNLAPWIKRQLNVKRVVINEGVTRIGSCAFANCITLKEVVFMGNDMKEIGWGAFLGCARLHNISLPLELGSIETIAFAKCRSLTSVKLPDHCRVADQAFVSCIGLKSLEIAPTVVLGQLVFATEHNENGVVKHTMYSGEVRKLPAYINKDNCMEFGLAVSAVETLTANRKATAVNYDEPTSDVDKEIPLSDYSRHDTYALIIGNQNYRFVSEVPYAIHDARVFGEYCKRTLGIPAGNIHIAEDATKQMILEEELSDWLDNLTKRNEKNLIVYYAGHGVPDVKNKNKAYILPTDVRGTNPKGGIELTDFYNKLGEFGFNQTVVFLDACFSGVNRENKGVSSGLRGVEIEAEEAELGRGSVVVFSAAQGNETAQGYPQEGHGLFTYFLLKQMQETSGDVNFGALSDYLKFHVSDTAPQLRLRKPQTPSTNVSEAISDSWRYLQF